MHSEVTAHARANNYSHSSNGMEPQHIGMSPKKINRKLTLQNNYKLLGFRGINVCWYLLLGNL
jgi:hypothetical protein